MSSHRTQFESRFYTCYNLGGCQAVLRGTLTGGAGGSVNAGQGDPPGNWVSVWLIEKLNCINRYAYVVCVCASFRRGSCARQICENILFYVRIYNFIREFKQHVVANHYYHVEYLPWFGGEFKSRIYRTNSAEFLVKL